MSDFPKRWQKTEDTKRLHTRIKESVNPPPPLKTRIEQASRQIQAQIARLNANSAKLSKKESSVFNKVVALLQKHDKDHANMLANELVELRKMSEIMTSAKLALEQISLRLNTIQGLGDVAATLSPTIGVIKGVRSQLVTVVPEAQNEIGEISNLLSGILSDAGQMNPSDINFEAANEEANKILAEASAVAERTVRRKFPDTPVPDDISDLEKESLS